jgi:glucose-6-phosphate isomerase, archaeal
VNEELLEPFTTTIDLRDGRLHPERHGTERRLSNMDGMFLEQPTQDAVVYRVYAMPAPETNSNIICSTTVLEPGTVGREYFMTKGHFHKTRDRAEVYVGLSGRGLLVMATESGHHTIEQQFEGSVNYIPGGWAHRSINVGDDPLVFFAAYIADAGHDYETIERRGFPIAVLHGPDGPQIIANPAYKE